MRACRTGDLARDHAGHRWSRLLGRLTLAFVLGLLAIAVLALGAKDTLANAQTLIRLLASPRGDGYWGRATVRFDGAQGLTEPDASFVCDVQSQYFVSGKDGGWREEARRTFLQGTPRLTLDDGREVIVRADSGLRFVPFEESIPPAADAEWFRSHWRSFNGPRLYASCLRPDTYFVDACIAHGGAGDPDALVPCNGAPHAWITDGPRRARLAVHATALARALGILVLGFAAVCWLMAFRLRGRSSESALGLAVNLAPRGLKASATIQDKLRRAARYAPTLAFPGFFLLLSAVSYVPRSVAFASLCIWGLALGALSPRARLRSLQALRRVVLDRPTSELASAEGDVVELSVRVTSSAPTFTAPLSGQRAAHASLGIWERVIRSSGRSTTVEYQRVYGGIVFGAVLPIQDATGGGSIELGEAILDFPALETVRKLNELPDAIRQQARLGHGEYLVRESLLQPGDPLYVLGPVQRTLDVSGEGQRAYRAAPTRARITPEHDDDSERHPLFVHAGTERTLLDAIEGGMRRERYFAGALLGLAAFATVALTGLGVLCLV